MPIIVDLSRVEKRRLRIWIRRETDAGLRTRMSIVLHLARGWPAAEVAASLHRAVLLLPAPRGYPHSNSRTIG